MPATATPTFTVNEVTSKLLKNFSTIQGSILLVPGTKQTTVAQGKSLFAVAELPDAWPEETGIYDLATFLGTLSLFGKPKIVFEKNTMVISDGALKVKYRMSDASTILTAPADEPGNKLRDKQSGVVFSLSGAMFSQLNKSIAVVGLRSASGAVVIDVKNGSVKLRGIDTKNPSAHSFELEVPEKDVTFTLADFENSITVKTEHLAMLLDGGYDINVSERKYVHFKHQTEPIQYYVVGGSTDK